MSELGSERVSTRVSLTAGRCSMVAVFVFRYS